MSAIYLLIPISLAVAVAFLMAFIWAVRSGQYDDTHTPALRILADEGENPNTWNQQAPQKPRKQHDTPRDVQIRQ